MPDSKTATLLRNLLNELCVSVSPSDVHARNVSSKSFETVGQDEASPDDLKAAGSKAPLRPPTMWR